MNIGQVAIRAGRWDNLGMRAGDGWQAIRGGAGALVGRRAELEEIAGLLRAARLLTLTGPGGVGKTRLALAAAERAGGAGAAVVVVPLADVRQGELVLGAVLAAAGVRERPGQERMQTLIDRLAGEPALLVLDNCEHLPAAVAELAEGLLRRTTKVRLLATSRRPLEVAGEVTWRTPPLAVPSADTETAVIESDAGELFVERAREADVGFALRGDAAGHVARLCRELEGQPLAIELAAARVRSEPLAGIVVGLADRLKLAHPDANSAPARQQTIRASLDWSYALLPDAERVVFRRLSVFAGWTVAAAREVAATNGVERAEMEGMLATLVQAGLVTVRTAGAELRYAMPETVRQYALERLVEAEEQPMICRRHLECFRELARSADELLDHSSGPDRLAEDGANVLAALEFALSRQDLTAVEIPAGLGLWWMSSDRFAEGRAVCARVLATLGELDPRSEALVRWAAAQLAFLAQDLADAHGHAALALALAGASGDPQAQGRCLQLMSVVLGVSDPARGVEMGRQAVELLRDAGDRHGLAHALIAFAMTSGQCDQFDAARAACAEFEALGAGRAHRWLRTWMEITLAWGAEFEGDMPAALAHGDIALELAGEEPSLLRCYALFNRVQALVGCGQAESAQREAELEIETATAAGLQVAAPILQYPLAVAELAQGQFESARARVAPLIDERHLPGAASAHELLAIIALAGEQPEPAGEHIVALRRIAALTGSERRRGLADLFDGVAALQCGSLPRAGELLHRGLASLLEHGFRRDATLALEALGALAAAESDTETAARLFGAAAGSRRRLGCVRVPPEESWLAQLRWQAQAAIEPSDWTLAWSEGESLALQKAAAYAARGRGKRLRPLGGWESLTPTEAEVARLAADGLSNPQIGERMFISRGTVKAHLAHIYDKLGVSNRTELATAAARQQLTQT